MPSAGSTRTVTGSRSLRALRTARIATRAALSCAPSSSGERSSTCSRSSTPDAGPPPRVPAPGLSGSGPRRSMSAGRSLRSRASCSACRLPHELGHPHRRRQRQLDPLGQLAGGEPGRVPAHQRLDHRQRGVRRGSGQHDHPAVAAGARERRRGGPPAQRLLGRVEGRPVEGRPGVQQQRRRVAAVGDRLGPGCGDHQAGAGVDPGQHLTGARGVHRHPGEGPAQLLGGAPRPDHAGAQGCGRRSAGTRTAPAPHRTSGRTAARRGRSAPAARRSGGTGPASRQVWQDSEGR